MTTQEQLDLYYLVRQVIWRYKLDAFENAALERTVELIRKAKKELLKDVSERPGLDTLRQEELAAYFDAMTVGIRSRLANDVQEIGAIAAEYSLREVEDMLSIGGLVRVNTVAISPEQMYSFFGADSSLPAWVESAWGRTAERAIKDTLDVGVLFGESYGQMVGRMMEHAIGNFTERDAVTIARTYVQTANVAAQMTSYEANRDIVSRWRWSSVLEPYDPKTGGGTCLRCAVNDQREFEFREGPPIPLHVNCLTGETTVVVPDKIAAFVATYCGPVIEIGLASGARFTVTPNHMFLTDKGFMPAKLLNEHSKIFYNPHADRVVGISPDDDRNPAKIKDIVETMAKTPGMTTVRVPATSKDLHGDGKFVNGYVDVVLPKCFLRGEGNATIPEQLPKGILGFSNMGKGDLGTDCPIVSPLNWLLLATDSLVSGKSVSDILLPGSFAHHKSIGGSAVAPRDALFSQDSGNNSAANLELFRDCIFRHARHVKGGDFFTRQVNGATSGGNAFFSNLSGNSGCTNSELLGNFALRHAGQIEFTNIVSKTTRNFSGHVYDLQSLSSMYYISGVLSSNCRCVALPVTKTWRELGVDKDEISEALRPYTIREGTVGAGGMREIQEVGRHQGSYKTWFEKQGPEMQERILGPGRYGLYSSGKVKFEDFISDDGRILRLDELTGGEQSA